LKITIKELRHTSFKYNILILCKLGFRWLQLTQKQHFHLWQILRTAFWSYTLAEGLWQTLGHHFV